MTSTQNRRLHALINQLKLQEMKASLVLQVTGNRTESSKEMSEPEAEELITMLLRQTAKKVGAKSANEIDPKPDKYRKRLIAMAYDMKPPPENPVKFVKEWAEKYGIHKNKKPFNDYTISELIGLAHKFQKVVDNHNSKHNDPPKRE